MHSTVDDDNIPLTGWGERLVIGKEIEVNMYKTDAIAFDPVGATNYPHLWHRGFPLQLIPTRSYATHKMEMYTPQVQADFWNGDPYIDAVCRMINAPNCIFDDNYFSIEVYTFVSSPPS